MIAQCAYAVDLRSGLKLRHGHLQGKLFALVPLIYSGHVFHLFVPCCSVPELVTQALTKPVGPFREVVARVLGF